MLWSHFGVATTRPAMVPLLTRPVRSGPLVMLGAGVIVPAALTGLGLACRLTQTADSAQGFVAGHAMARGNVLLSGWHFPFNDYYFTDTLAYAALEWLLGPRPFLLALLPALTYAGFVLVALLVCLRPSQPLARNIEAAATLALPLGAPAWIGSWNPLLMSDMHMGAVLGTLIAIALYARVARFERFERSKIWPFAGLCAAAAVVTAATLASDPFGLVFAFGPALAVLAVGGLSFPRADGARVAPLVLAGGIALGILLPLAIARAGGFTTESDVVTGFVAIPLLGRNLVALVLGSLTLFGANPFATDSGTADFLSLPLRFIAFAAALAAVVHVTRCLFGRGRAALFDRMLCAGILATLAACLFSAQFGKGITDPNIWTGGPPMRYLMPAVLFAAVLAGRQMPKIIRTSRDARKNRHRDAETVRNPRVPVSLCLCGEFLASRGLAVLAVLAIFAGAAKIEAQPLWIADDPPATAARWLAAHGLTQGAGEYWSANLITAISGDAVHVRSFVPEGGKLAPYVWSSDGTENAHAPQFVIWRDENPTGVTTARVRATWSVCRVVSVAGYRIAIISNPFCVNT